MCGQFGTVALPFLQAPRSQPVSHRPSTELRMQHSVALNAAHEGENATGNEIPRIVSGPWTNPGASTGRH
jgi:hypothetical protein